MYHIKCSFKLYLKSDLDLPRLQYQVKVCIGFSYVKTHSCFFMLKFCVYQSLPKHLKDLNKEKNRHKFLHKET